MTKYRGPVLFPALIILVGVGLWACGDDTPGGGDDGGALDAAADGAAPDSGQDAGTSIAYGCEDPAGRTVGLQSVQSEAFEGYTLLAPLSSVTTYLIDVCGRVVHQWEGEHKPGNAVYLLPNGHLLRTENPVPPPNPTFAGGGLGGRVLEQDWEGNVVWDFRLSDATQVLHHDVEMLPNGNVLMIAWEHKTQAEAVAAGRSPATLGDGELWPDKIVEVQPDGLSGGIVVWEWHAWDHLVQDFDPAQQNYGVVGDHPELIDINHHFSDNADFMHTNAVDYNPDLDQIVISVHHFSELWIIDHSTTTAEAAGHIGGSGGRGGDLLYRWGNPAMYDAGDTADQQLFVQHDTQWIEAGLPGAGNLLVFNNGANRSGSLSYSSVDEIVPPVDGNGLYPLAAGAAWEPTAPVWSYEADPPADFYGDHISGAQRLPNGNTLICNGPSGEIFEVTPAGSVVWRYISPVALGGVVTQGEPIPQSPNGGPSNSLFRATRHAATDPALTGRTLTPGDYIELPAQP